MRVLSQTDMTVTADTDIWREIVYALRYYVENNSPTSKVAEQAWIEEIEEGIRRTENPVDVHLTAGILTMRGRGA